MANVTIHGMEPTSLNEYIIELNQVFRDAFGDDLNVSGDTPQGVLIGVLANLFHELDQVIVALGNSNNLDLALGTQLDDLGTLYRLYRNDERYASLLVRLTGTDDVAIPTGSRIQTSDGKTFALASGVTLPFTGARFNAEEPGPLGVSIETELEIIDIVQGWETAIAISPDFGGRLRETDFDFRERIKDQITRTRVGGSEALIRSVRSTNDVRRVKLIENATASTEKNALGPAYDLPAHSIAIAVEGGADRDVANAIEKVKPIGIPTQGNVTIKSTPTFTFQNSVSWYKPDTVKCNATISITTASNFPSDGIIRVKNRVKEYIDNIDIGDPYDQNRLIALVYRVPGVIVNSITLTGTRMTHRPGAQPSLFNSLDDLKEYSRENHEWLNTYFDTSDNIIAINGSTRTYYGISRVASSTYSLGDTPNMFSGSTRTEAEANRDDDVTLSNYNSDSTKVIVLIIQNDDGSRETIIQNYSSSAWNDLSDLFIQSETSTLGEWSEHTSIEITGLPVTAEVEDQELGHDSHVFEPDETFTGTGSAAAIANRDTADSNGTITVDSNTVNYTTTANEDKVIALRYGNTTRYQSWNSTDSAWEDVLLGQPPFHNIYTIDTANVTVTIT